MKIETACMACGRRYRVDGRFIGRSIRCEKCSASFTIAGPPQPERPDDYMEGFRAVKAELEKRLGPADEDVHASAVPLHVDSRRGLAESLRFRKKLPGMTYCTCGLSLMDEMQRCEPGGNFELMIRTREPWPPAAGLIGSLGAFSLQMPLPAGVSIDLGPQPAEMTVCSMLACEPDVEEPEFLLFGKVRRLRLLIGVTRAELEACRERGARAVVSKLKDAGVFPYTDCERASVV